MPTIEQAEWFLKTGAIHGLGFIAIAGILWLIGYGSYRGINACIGVVIDIRTKWLPKLVDGHLTFLEHTKTSNARTSEAVEKLTDSYGASMDNHSKTHRALACIVQAQQQGDVCDEARKYLDDAIRELQ